MIREYATVGEAHVQKQQKRKFKEKKSTKKIKDIQIIFTDPDKQRIKIISTTYSSSSSWPSSSSSSTFWTLSPALPPST